MIRINKHPFALKSLIAIVSFVFATVGFAANVNSARIIPKGTVSIIKDGNVVGEFSNEAPLPEGSLLKCDEQCAVKTDDVYMVAQPDTVFSVSPMANPNELSVQEGTVYFSIDESSRPLQFDTPAGVVTTLETSLTDSELRGYVRVVRNEAEVGVIGGGTMIVDTPSGEMAILPGEKVTLAMVNPPVPYGSAAAGEEGSSIATDVLLGLAGTAVIVGGIYALAVTFDGGDGDNNQASPSSP